MRWGAVTVTILAASAPSSHALAVDDAEALALVQKHCVMCHAAKPTHESFQEAPKNITLETIADIRKHALTILAQTTQTKAMPLGNQTGMSDEERATLAQWLKNQQ
ncbi:MAG: c-type cytochrome [Pseudolabrys sp.]